MHLISVNYIHVTIKTLQIGVYQSKKTNSRMLIMQAVVTYTVHILRFRGHSEYKHFQLSVYSI